MSDQTTLPEAPANPNLGRRAKVVRDDSQKGGKRLYRIVFTEEDGTTRPIEDYWSTTTLLKGMPNQALPRWAARETAVAALDDIDYWKSELGKWDRDEVVFKLAGAPYSKSSKKADLGSLVHGQIEALILGGEPPPLADDVRDAVHSYVDQYKRFEDRFEPEYEASELTVVHTQHRWAGTLDAIAGVAFDDGERRRLLLDFKTTRGSGKNHQSPGVYLEHACQLSCYRHAEFAIDRSGLVVPMPVIDGGAVLWLAPDRWALVELDTGDRMYRLFRFAAEIFVATDTQRQGWFIREEHLP